MKALATAVCAACLISSSPLFATLDLLYVNHTTRQLAWMDEERLAGFFWHCAGGEEHHRLEAEAKYLPLGYRYTNSPVVVEKTVLLALFCIASLLAGIKILIALRRKCIRHS